MSESDNWTKIFKMSDTMVIEHSWLRFTSLQGQDQSQVTTTESGHHQQNNDISIPVGFNSSKDISQYKESNKLYKLVKVKTSFVLIITKDYNWTLTDIP